jgi:hypothetical protein
MAYEHESVIRAQYQQLAADRAQALAEYEAGRIKEDDFETMSAANRILEADQKRMALDRIAHTFVASQQQPQGNQYGLSESEVTIARGISSGDRTLTNADRERIYAEKKQQLSLMRQRGEYVDQTR